VSSGAALQIQGNITTAAEALTLNGTGVSTDGALRNISGNNNYAGLVTLASATRINSDAGTLTLSNAGTITGAGFGLSVGGAGNATIASSIGTGTGTLSKDGAGTLTLSGANTYSGATTVSAGTLQIGNGGTTGSLAAASSITNNGTLVFNRSNTFTLNNVISGTGAVTQAGSGTVVFSGANTYTGATTVSAGSTLHISDGSISTSSSIINNGTLSFRGYNKVITQGTDFNSVISGPGAVINSSGHMVLNGANTYTGLTTAIGGLTIQSANALGSTAAGTIVTSGAALRIQGNITTAEEALTLKAPG
jgi:autotransporter-associated beta strand protein